MKFIKVGKKYINTKHILQVLENDAVLAVLWVKQDNYIQTNESIKDFMNRLNALSESNHCYEVEK